MNAPWMPLEEGARDAARLAADTDESEALGSQKRREKLKRLGWQGRSKCRPLLEQFAFQGKWIIEEMSYSVTTNVNQVFDIPV